MGMVRKRRTSKSYIMNRFPQLPGTKWNLFLCLKNFNKYEQKINCISEVWEIVSSFFAPFPQIVDYYLLLGIPALMHSVPLRGDWKGFVWSCPSQPWTFVDSFASQWPHFFSGFHGFPGQLQTPCIRPMESSLPLDFELNMFRFGHFQQYRR